MLLSVGAAGNGIQSLSKSHSPNLLLPNRNRTPFLSLFPIKSKFRPISISNSSSSQTLDESIISEEGPKKRGVVVKPLERPRLVLKFIWMEKNIGIALDQVIPGGHGTIPLSPYYFWPRKDAWEELRLMLESKQWISRKQVVVLLNQATDIINLWQQSGGGDLP